MKRAILHVDMDAFYASIEQRDRPEYRGKPLVVGGKSSRGVVSTASYEARKYGIHSAMPIKKAYRLCPQAIFVSSDLEKYKRVSEEIMDIFRNITPLVEPLSLDEAFLDVSSCQKIFGSPLEIAKKIQQEIVRKHSLTCSIGISENKFLAKIASDLKKPQGISSLWKKDLREKLWPLALEKLWGVGPKTAESLHELNLKTIGDVAKCPRKLLEQKCGKLGRDLSLLANGKDDREVDAKRKIQSVGQENTFLKDINNKETLKTEILKLSEEVARRLRAKKIKGKTLTVKIRLADFTTLNRSKTLNHYTNNSEEIYNMSYNLFLENYDGKSLLRLVGVSMSNLISYKDENQQLCLFQEKEKIGSELENILDNLNEKYGQGTILKARLLDKENWNK